MLKVDPKSMVTLDGPLVSILQYHQPSQFLVVVISSISLDARPNLFVMLSTILPFEIIYYSILHGVGLETLTLT